MMLPVTALSIRKNSISTLIKIPANTIRQFTTVSKLYATVPSSWTKSVGLKKSTMSIALIVSASLTENSTFAKAW